MPNTKENKRSGQILKIEQRKKARLCKTETSRSRSNTLFLFLYSILFVCYCLSYAVSHVVRHVDTQLASLPFFVSCSSCASRHPICLNKRLNPVVRRSFLQTLPKKNTTAWIPPPFSNWHVFSILLCILFSHSPTKTGNIKITHAPSHRLFN
ncbi:MAG: hypothetical protein JOS17DRAFT_24482 [Linnemannia elongata]|nr:MAG: hypothetical protein JOS17DRAFT_24482 [Linnemannia elongata]